MAFKLKISSRRGGGRRRAAGAARSSEPSRTWRSSARDAPGVARALSRLGKRVRALRLDRTLTQGEAAGLAKLDEKHWQDIEGARTNPTVATLVGIARALKVTVSELF